MINTLLVRGDRLMFAIQQGQTQRGGRFSLGQFVVRTEGMKITGFVPAPKPNCWL